MTAPDKGPKSRKLLTTIGVAVAFLIVVVVLMIWLAGGFHAKIDSPAARKNSATPTGRQIPANAQTATVRAIEVPRIETAAGTVRAVHETAIASKLLAKVMEVHVTAGQQVRAGEVLVQLDNNDLTARLQQAEAAANAARASRDQAKIEFDRVDELLKQGAASQIEWDRVNNALKSAEAELQRAQQAANEAQTVLGYATIHAPIDGVVIDKKIEVGDTATPGQVLLTLYDPTRMQLVASVRESLTHRLKVGQTIGVNIETVDHVCQGRISEIVPEAESATRTFAVKVTGPCPPGVYSGMFGRLLIPLDTEAVLVIPRAAVRHVGQLNLVDMVDSGRMQRRIITLGRSFDDDVEVLSGLREGESVLITEGQSEGTAS